MMVDPILIPIFGVLIPIVVVPASLTFKYFKFKRECEHAERMKALEVGATLPGDEPWWSPSRICVAIGAGVPIGVFGLAWLASTSSNAREEVWIGASMVGLTSVICGSILAAKEFTRRGRAEAAFQTAFAKPYFDADAYDVAGRRG
jgi:hypothetical protein